MRRSGPLRFGAVALAAVVLSGCTGAMSDVVVPISLDGRPPEVRQETVPVSIEVYDLRRQSTMRRTTIGDVSMGSIILSPPEMELVRRIVSDALQRTAAGRIPPPWPKVACGIKIFDVVTPATALYWDVTAHVELILRIEGWDREVAGEAKERTYVWPSAEVIGRVTTQALQQVAAAVERELSLLLGTRP
jgi:hypothetical protein